MGEIRVTEELKIEMEKEKEKEKNNKDEIHTPTKVTSILIVENENVITNNVDHNVDPEGDNMGRVYMSLLEFW
nr:hypothetical protein [Tanacetum cinerariifolium]